jgi:hypothetical protein
MDITKGDADYDIPPVYLVAILSVECLNRELPSWGERFISEYTFREKVTGDTPDDTIFCTFVELKRFDKKLSECRDIIDKWCYALKYMSRLDKLPKEFQMEVFRRLFEASEIAQFSEDKRIKYEQEMISERDYNNILATAREEGLKMGYEEGREEGRKKGRAEGFEEGREIDFVENTAVIFQREGIREAETVAGHEREHEHIHERSGDEHEGKQIHRKHRKSRGTLIFAGHAVPPSSFSQRTAAEAGISNRIVSPVFTDVSRP